MTCQNSLLLIEPLLGGPESQKGRKKISNNCGYAICIGYLNSWRNKSKKRGEGWLGKGSFCEGVVGGGVYKLTAVQIWFWHQV